MIDFKQLEDLANAVKQYRLNDGNIEFKVELSLGVPLLRILVDHPDNDPRRSHYGRSYIYLTSEELKKVYKHLSKILGDNND